MNAHDGFVPDRTLETSFTVDGLELAGLPRFGRLSHGRMSLSLAVADGQPEGFFEARSEVLYGSRSGAVKTLVWDCKIEHIPERRHRDGGNGDRGSGGRPVVVYAEGPAPDCPGEVIDELTGKEVAELYPQVSHVAGIDRRVVLITIHSNYKPWERYASRLAQDTSDATVTRNRNRYITGVAVALGQLNGLGRVKRHSPPGFDDDQRLESLRIAAHAVLASLERAEEP